MKILNFYTINQGALLCNKRLRVALLSLSMLFFANGLSAQCNEIAFNFEHYEPCKFRLTYDNSNECYNEIQIVLEQGQFASWNIIPNSGFIVQQISPSELTITHSGGFMPLGFQVPLLFTLPVDLVTNVGVYFLNDCPPAAFCILIPTPVLESCLDPEDASITGLKYRECGSNPYFNQATLAGWTIQLLDAMDNVVDEQVTDMDGAYAFYDLSAGTYTVKETQQPGWTPKVPASGKSTVVLDPSEQEVRNFGNCPGCSCDSIYLFLSRVTGASDTSTYYLNINNSGEYCFSYVDVKVDSGQLITWNALLPGWTISVQGPNFIRLTPPDAYLPGGSSIPMSLLVSGMEHHNFTVSAFMGNGMGGVACTRSYSFPGLSMPFSTDCCPAGTIQGPELVTDGTFDAATPQFTWTGYNYVLAGGSGNISMVTSAQIPTLNSQWICPSKSGLPTDPFLFVDGSITAGAFAWEQQPSAPITPSKQYSFSATINNLYLATLPGTPDPTVELSIVDVSNNIVFQTLSVLPENPDNWVQVCGLWTSPASLNPPYTLRIRTTSTGASGNDFAVDCISFRSCSVPCTANFNFTDNSCGKFTFTGIATGTPNFSYSWNFGDPASGALNFSTLPSPVHQYTSSGPHTVMVTITDGTGCMATYSTSISVPTFPTSVNITGNPGLSYCQGQSTILTASGGPWSSCLWSNSGSGSTTVITSPGTYCITCTDFNGCTATGCVTVVELPKPTASITGNLSICVGQSTLLTASGGGNYSWTPGGSNNAMITVSPTVTTTYTVLVTSGNTCTATSSVTVTVNPLPVFTLTNQTICIGQSATLTAAGGGTYLWSPGGATTPAITVNPTVTTTYTVLVTSPLGCTKTGSATVTVNPLPVFTLTNQSICSGQSATLTAAGGGTYLWNPGGAITASITVSPTATTTYTVLVTSTAGCTKTGSATVTVNPLPVFTLTNKTICTGQSATLTAAGGGTYLWSPGGATTAAITVNPTVTTTYTVLVTSPLGCTKTGSATVTVNPLPVFTLTNQTICTGQSTTLTAAGGGTYLWSPGGATTAAITVSPTATTTYTVLVTSPLGCTKTGSATVTVNPLPVFTLTNQTICTGQSATLTAAGGGTYLWSPGGATTAAITVSPTATTTYTVLVTSSAGCTKTGSATVTVNPLPVFTLTNQTICVGQSATLTAAGGGTYLWSPGGATTPAITVNPTVTTTYTVLVTSPLGCTKTGSATVTVNPLPVFTLTNQTICAGQSATLTATGGGTYLWSPGGATTPAITVSPAATTTYTVLVTSPAGCTKTGSATVTVNPLPNANAGIDKKICLGKSITLTATGGVSYMWSPNGSTQNPYPVSPSVTTTYTVTVTNANGCTATDQAVVTVNPVPTVDAGLDQTMCAGQSATLTATASGGTPPYTYNWGFFWLTNPAIISPSQDVTWPLDVIDANGCHASDQLDIDVISCCGTSLVQNWDFEQTNNPLSPVGYEDIWGATNWEGIWLPGPGSNRNGDYWDLLGIATGPKILSPCFVADDPIPNAIQSGGKYAGFICGILPGTWGKIMRQGILNNLNGTINPTIGTPTYYKVSMQIACPCTEIGTSQMDVYGVYSGAYSTVTPLCPGFPNGPNSGIPSNGNLFGFVPCPVFGAGAKWLGTITVPNSVCDEYFKTFYTIFDAQTISFPVDRIFLTRRDYISTGKTYLAIDDVCIEKVGDVNGNPICDCAALATGTIYQGGTGVSSAISCNTPAPFVQLPCRRQGFNTVLYGRFPCNTSNCIGANNTVSWVLTSPGQPTHTGTFSTSSLGYPNFSITMPWSWFPLTGGSYTLTLTRQCGGKTCSCTMQFNVAACACICDNAFSAAVNQGFSVVGPTPLNSCVRKLQPVALCPNDQVLWTVQGGATFGPSSSNNIQQVTFPGPGSFQVCMLVTRTQPDGITCTTEKCQNVNVSCGFDPTGTIFRFCDAFNTLKNGDFRDTGTIVGLLGDGGWMPEWDLATNFGDGHVIIDDSTGANDEGHLVLIGGEGNFSGIVQEVNVQPDSFINISCSYKNYLGTESPGGTSVEIRLHENPFPWSEYQILHSWPVDTLPGWQRKTMEIHMPPDTSLKYLVICVQNNDSIRRSAIGLDNLEFCTSQTPLSGTPEIQKSTNIRIYPNPNPGTFNVALPEPATPNMRFHIVSLTGQKLREQSIQTGSTIQTVQMSDLPAGLYFLQVLTEGKVLAVEKFVKQ